MDDIDYDALDKLTKEAKLHIPRGLSSRPIDEDIKWDTIEKQVTDGGNDVNITDNEYLNEEASG